MGSFSLFKKLYNLLTIIEFLHMELPFRQQSKHSYSRRTSGGRRPFSLGIETVGGVMSKIIKRNSRILRKQSKSSNTYFDNQPTVTIHVYEGKRAMSNKNNPLGTFNLTGIPPALEASRKSSSLLIWMLTES